jgi:hypothetical protein
VRRELTVALMARDLRVERSRRLSTPSSLLVMGDDTVDSSYVVDKAMQCG